MLDDQAYLVWLAGRNTPDPAPTLPTPPPTTLQIVTTSYGAALNGTYPIDGSDAESNSSLSRLTSQQCKVPAHGIGPKWRNISLAGQRQGHSHVSELTAFQNFASAVASMWRIIDFRNGRCSALHDTIDKKKYNAFFIRFLLHRFISKRYPSASLCSFHDRRSDLQATANLSRRAASEIFNDSNQLAQWSRSPGASQQGCSRQGV